MTTFTDIYLTGNNNYSGEYDITGFTVLGAPIGSNTTGDSHTWYDTASTTPFDETFLFGDLQYKHTVAYDNADLQTDLSKGMDSFQTTATGTGGDTIVFSFNLTETTTQETSKFFDGEHSHDLSLDSDGSTDFAGTGASGPYYETSASVDSYDAWLTAHSGSGWALSSPLSIEFGADQQDGTVGQKVDSDSTSTNFLANAYTVAMENVTTVTAVHAEDAGNKILLGFTVDPTGGVDPTQGDHINLSGDQAIDKATFDKYFSVNADTHISANGNVVNDTVIALDPNHDFTAIQGTNAGNHAYGTGGGGWSVDLYGVDIATLQAGAAAANGGAGESVNDYVYQTIVSHA